jgi:hypothetical protein
MGKENMEDLQDPVASGAGEADAAFPERLHLGSGSASQAEFLGKGLPCIDTI